MIVKALRIAEIGPFSSGIALENLSGGLDVLVGANELGKSSIFRALVTLIEEKHTASSARITRLRHAGGGAPLIEADFEVAGHRIRVRKRYLSQRSATLLDLDNGQTLRGPDAETRLEELLSPAAHAGAPRRLLWVGQTESFALPAPTAIAAPLTALIEREVAETTGAGLARRVTARIATELAKLQTSHKPPRPTGALKVAIDAHAAAQHALHDLRQKAAATQERRTELAAHSLAEARLTAPETVAALNRTVADAQHAVEGGLRAREQLRVSAERLAAARQLDQAAAKVLADFAARIAEHRNLTSALQTTGAERNCAIEHQHTAASTLAALEQRQADLLADIQATRANHSARLALDARNALTDLEDRASSAARSATLIAELEAITTADRAHARTIVEARRSAADIAQCEAEIRVGTARVHIAYDPAATHRLSVAGRTLADGETLPVDAPLTITIPGIGTIAIEPGRSGTHDATTRLATFREELQTLLSDLGVTDLAAAEHAQAEAAKRSEALAVARARLGSLAPSGIDAITAELTRLRALAGAAPPSQSPCPPSLTEIDRQLAALDAARNQLDRDVASARNAAAAAAAAVIKLDTTLAAQHQRLAALDAQIATDADADARLAELTTAAASARSAHVDARREHDDWAIRTPDAVALSRAEAELSRARTAAAERDAQLAQVRQSIARLQWELARDEADGIGAELIRHEEQAVSAAAHLARIERDAAALGLLSAKLQAAEAAHRGTTLRPLTDRLAPLLASLLPDAALELAGPAEIASLVRRNRAEPYAQLSDGTREQIAILVRLAWARILAERGVPTPVVLDDALVYSDDERLTRMFALLSDAARHHQVLVLSCHETATLAAAKATNANVLTPKPWLGDEPRAVAARA